MSSAETASTDAPATMRSRRHRQIRKRAGYSSRPSSFRKTLTSSLGMLASGVAIAGIHKNDIHSGTIHNNVNIGNSAASEVKSVAALKMESALNQSQSELNNLLTDEGHITEAETREGDVTDEELGKLGWKAPREQKPRENQTVQQKDQMVQQTHQMVQQNQPQKTLQQQLELQHNVKLQPATIMGMQVKHSIVRKVVSLGGRDHVIEHENGMIEREPGSESDRNSDTTRDPDLRNSGTGTVGRGNKVHVVDDFTDSQASGFGESQEEIMMTKFGRESSGLTGSITSDAMVKSMTVKTGVGHDFKPSKDRSDTSENGVVFQYVPSPQEGTGVKEITDSENYMHHSDIDMLPLKVEENWIAVSTASNRNTVTDKDPLHNDHPFGPLHSEDQISFTQQQNSPKIMEDSDSPHSRNTVVQHSTMIKFVVEDESKPVNSSHDISNGFQKFGSDGSEFESGGGSDKDSDKDELLESVDKDLKEYLKESQAEGIIDDKTGKGAWDAHKEKVRKQKKNELKESGMWDEHKEKVLKEKRAKKSEKLKKEKKRKEGKEEGKDQDGKNQKSRNHLNDLNPPDDFGMESLLQEEVEEMGQISSSGNHASKMGQMGEGVANSGFPKQDLRKFRWAKDGSNEGAQDQIQMKNRIPDLKPGLQDLSRDSLPQQETIVMTDKEAEAMQKMMGRNHVKKDKKMKQKWQNKTIDQINSKKFKTLDKKSRLNKEPPLHRSAPSNLQSRQTFEAQFAENLKVRKESMAQTQYLFSWTNVSRQNDHYTNGNGGKRFLGGKSKTAMKKPVKFNFSKDQIMQSSGSTSMMRRSNTSQSGTEMNRLSRESSVETVMNRLSIDDKEEEQIPESQNNSPDQNDNPEQHIPEIQALRNLGYKPDTDKLTVAQFRKEVFDRYMFVNLSDLEKLDFESLKQLPLEELREFAIEILDKLNLVEIKETLDFNRPQLKGLDLEVVRNLVRAQLQEVKLSAVENAWKGMQEVMGKSMEKSMAKAKQGPQGENQMQEANQDANGMEDEVIQAIKRMKKGAGADLQEEEGKENHGAKEAKKESDGVIGGKESKDVNVKNLEHALGNLNINRHEEENKEDHEDDPNCNLDPKPDIPPIQKLFPKGENLADHLTIEKIRKLIPEELQENDLNKVTNLLENLGTVLKSIGEQDPEELLQELFNEWDSLEEDPDELVDARENAPVIQEGYFVRFANRAARVFRYAKGAVCATGTEVKKICKTAGSGVVTAAQYAGTAVTVAVVMLALSPLVPVLYSTLAVAAPLAFAEASARYFGFEREWLAAVTVAAELAITLNFGFTAYLKVFTLFAPLIVGSSLVASGSVKGVANNHGNHLNGGNGGGGNAVDHFRGETMDITPGQ